MFLSNASSLINSFIRSTLGNPPLPPPEVSPEVPPSEEEVNKTGNDADDDDDDEDGTIFRDDAMGILRGTKESDGLKTNSNPTNDADRKILMMGCCARSTKVLV